MAGNEIETLEKELGAKQATALKELRAKYGEAVERAISQARSSGIHAAVEVSDGAEAYAYPLKRGCIARGVNSAETNFNIWRGVRRPMVARKARSKPQADESTCLGGKSDVRLVHPARGRTIGAAHSA